MKKIIAIVLILIISIIMTGCCTRATTDENKESLVHAFVLVGYNVYSFDVEKYVRISSGWIVITATDGRIFHTNERNVVLIEEAAK